MIDKKKRAALIAVAYYLNEQAIKNEVSVWWKVGHKIKLDNRTFVQTKRRA